jgi:hypothetical protein
MDGGKKVRMKPMSNVNTVRVCSLNTVMLKISKVDTRCLCELWEKGIMCDRCRK